MAREGQSVSPSSLPQNAPFSFMSLPFLHKTTKQEDSMYFPFHSLPFHSILLLVIPSTKSPKLPLGYIWMDDMNWNGQTYYSLVGYTFGRVKRPLLT